MNTMRALNRKAQVVVVIAAILIATTPIPVRAQVFGGIVYDPTNYVLQVEKRVEEAARWVQTIDQYLRMYENAVRQLTTLTGVLKTAEQHLGFHQRTLTTISSIGKTILPLAIDRDYQVAGSAFIIGIGLVGIVCSLCVI